MRTLSRSSPEPDPVGRVRSAGPPGRLRAWSRPGAGAARSRTVTYALSAALALVVLTACGTNTSPQAGESQFDVAKFDVAMWE
jgi:hypothetical protein